MVETVNKEITKLYKIFAVATGLRLTLPKQVSWSNGDHIKVIIVDEDTVTLKRVLKSEDLKSGNFV